MQESMTSEAQFESEEPAGGSRTPFIVIGAVILVGLLIALAVRPGDPSSSVPEIEWIPLEVNQAGTPNPVSAGPGGLLRAIDGFKFSTDGRTWESVGLSPANAERDRRISGGVDIEATQDLWMIEHISLNRTIWLSADGHEWERHRLDRDFARNIDTIESAVGGFYAIRDRRDRMIFWSADGLEWTEIEGLVDRGRSSILRSYSGLALVDYDNPAAIEFEHTADGVTWVQGSIAYDQIALPGFAGLTGIEVVDDKWIATGVRVNEANGVRKLDVVFWSSNNGINWTFAGVIEPAEGSGFSTQAIHMDDLVLFPTVTEQENDDLVHQWWATRDGITWDSFDESIVVPGTPGNALPHVAGIRNDDGTYTVVHIVDDRDP